jgi:hypothetical protein
MRASAGVGLHQFLALARPSRADPGAKQALGNGLLYSPGLRALEHKFYYKEVDRWQGDMRPG